MNEVDCRQEPIEESPSIEDIENIIRNLKEKRQQSVIAT